MLCLVLPAGRSGAADLVKAEAIVQAQCFVCHGLSGERASAVFPRLAGQHASYVARQLAAFQKGQRKSSTMQSVVEGLTPDDMQALGAWAAAQPTLAQPVDDPELAEQGRALHLLGKPQEGVPACASCHGAEARGSATLPRLAGQHPAYIEAQLANVGRQARGPDWASLHNIQGRLSALELKAVATYLSGLQ